MKWFIAVIATCVLLGPAALADPSWTPQTYQLFDFLHGDFDGAPIVEPGMGPFGTDRYTYSVNATVDDNPFGDPWALVEVDTMYDTLPDVSGGYNPSGDYFHAWAISVGSGMWMPNSQVPNPIKNIWVEIRYDPDLVEYRVEPPDDSYAVSLVDYLDMPENPTNPGGWRIAQIEWQVRSNPPYETLWFDFLDAGTKLDYIAVYTQCVPIPSAVLLAVLGFCTAGWRLRRRQT